jgi:hypothetical protein
MTSRLTPLAAALIACGALSGPAGAQSLPELKFSGFGTLAAVHSSEKNADFVGNLFQPSGAGHTDSVSLRPDSKIAGQVGATFNDKVSAVLQVVSQHNYDNSWTPRVEWANVKYQATPGLSLRAGRFALPVFLLSESRYVGYASPWVRPPVDVYDMLPITSGDGIDATYRNQISGANNVLHAYYGNNQVSAPGGVKAKSNPGWGVNDSVEIGSLAVRAAYNSLNLDIQAASLGQLVGGFSTLGTGLAGVPVPSFQTASAQALALAQKYKLQGMKLSTVTLGATYDPGDWFLTGEALELKGSGLLANKTAWYVSGGYRFGSLTPYVTYSETKARIAAEPGVSAVGDPTTDAGIAALNAGLQAAQRQLGYSQNTSSLGLRWDAVKNVAVKAQYDRIKLSPNSAGSLINVQPGFVGGGQVNLFTVAVDFVF